MTRRVSVRMRVPFHDVDALQIVWHGHYYKYFEIARTELMATCGLSIEAWDVPYKWVVIETKCRYVSALGIGHRIRVDAWFRDIDHRVNVAYELFNETTSKRAARGHTILATLNMSDELQLQTPPVILERLRGNSDD